MKLNIASLPPLKAPLTKRIRRALLALTLLSLTPALVSAAPARTIPSRRAKAQASTPLAVLAAVPGVELAFTIDRTGLPPLAYSDLTLKVDALGATTANVTVDGVAVASRISAGKVVFTTSGRSVVVKLSAPTDTTRAGSFEKAALKDDKAWAWSHGFDDNTNLKPGIDAFRARGWRATVFMICNIIDNTRQEDWILDAPGLKQLLGEGWGVGNHTWDHAAVSNVAAARQSVTTCSERLAGIVAASPRPTYKVTAFAAPVFDAGYAPIIRALRDSHTTDLLFDESGNDYSIRVDPGATTAPAGAVLFSPDLVIGRYTPIAWDAPATKAQIDTVAGQANATTHLWFNTLAHGSSEASLVPVLTYVYSTYGPAGQNNVLVAPSDEIYSYLLVRDRSTVTYNGSRVTTPPGGGATGPDFNGDGKADILWHNQSTGALQVWLMNGATRLSSATPTPGLQAETAWQVRALADFNGDGKTDILWHHQTTGDLYVWFMNGVASTGGGYLNPTGVADLAWQIQGTGDFNTDGKADLLWRNTTTGDLAVWLMNGTTAAGTALLQPGRTADPRWALRGGTPGRSNDPNWQVRGVADFNGDGKPDILWRHQTTGSLYVWLLSGTTIGGGTYLSPSRVADTAWQVRGLVDLDGDGKTDLVWQNQTTGALNTWLMVGTSLLREAPTNPAGLGDPQWQVVPR